MISTALIVGAGIGGLVTAIRLAQLGVKVEVFERSPIFGEVGAGIQLSPNALHVLAALGLAEAITAFSFEPKRGVIRDFKTGQPEFTTKLSAFSERRYGQKYLHCHRVDLHTLLQAAAKTAGVTLHLGAEVTSYTQSKDEISLQLASGENHKADMLIGADGVKSIIRETMLGPHPPQYTGQVAWRGLVPASKVPPETVPPDATIWCGPGKHFVTYYLRGGDLINFVAVEEQENWQNEDWNIPGDMTDLRTAFVGWDDRIGCLLEACDECFLWGLFDRAPLNKWTDGRAALLGDACHPMLPFMAQGASMAIEDAYVLAQQVMKANLSVSEALPSYEKIRKPRTTKLQKISRANAKTFHLQNPSAIALRKTKYKIGSLIPGLAAMRLDSIYGKDVTKLTSK